MFELLHRLFGKKDGEAVKDRVDIEEDVEAKREMQQRLQEATQRLRTIEMKAEVRTRQTSEER